MVAAQIKIGSYAHRPVGRRSFTVSVRLLFADEGKVIKKWNWKIFRRVVLILLILGIATQCYVNAKTLQTQNKFGSPWLKVKCWDKNYPLEDVNVQLSIGLYESEDTNRSNIDFSQDYDSFLGFAIYFCTPDDLRKILPPVEKSKTINLGETIVLLE